MRPFRVYGLAERAACESLDAQGRRGAFLGVSAFNARRAEIGPMANPLPPRPPPCCVQSTPHSAAAARQCSPRRTCLGDVDQVLALSQLRAPGRVLPVALRDCPGDARPRIRRARPRAGPACRATGSMSCTASTRSMSAMSSAPVMTAQQGVERRIELQRRRPCRQFGDGNAAHIDHCSSIRYACTGFTPGADPRRRSGLRL